MQKITYTTIAEPFQFEIPKIKGSRFFASVFPCESREQAEERLAKMHKRYYDATHNCSAYRVGVSLQYDIFGTPLIQAGYAKANDDGEPTNTAGKPILTVIEGEKIHNVLVVVTRYFGGTLLGVGGLIQAYTQAAQAALQHVPRVTREIYATLEISLTYDQLSLIHHLLDKYEAKIIGDNYGDQIIQTFNINQGYVSEFLKELKEKSNGQLEAQVLKDKK